MSPFAYGTMLSVDAWSLCVQLRTELGGSLVDGQLDAAFSI